MCTSHAFLSSGTINITQHSFSQWDLVSSHEPFHLFLISNSVELGQRLRPASNTFSLFPVTSDTLAKMTPDPVGGICIMGWKLSSYFLKTTMYLVQMSNVLSFILYPVSIPNQISILKGLGSSLKQEPVFNLTKTNLINLSSSVQDFEQTKMHC